MNDHDGGVLFGDDRPRADSIPFSSERRYIATLNRDPDDVHFIYVKGAPERVLEVCSREQRGDDTAELDRDAGTSRAEKIAQRGQCVLAVARRRIEMGVSEMCLSTVFQTIVSGGGEGTANPNIWP